jgi:hypothetical protein
MKPKTIAQLADNELSKLIENRWQSSDEVWQTVKSTYETNTSFYDNEGDWLNKLPTTIEKTQANRITPNMEAVINSVIANPPGFNFIPGRESEQSQELARKLERFYLKKYQDLNIKEDMRMGLRNLYFARLIVLKPFWNKKINDFDVKSIDPRNVRFSKFSTKEVESEFAIEEVEDNLIALLDRFPEKADQIIEKAGFTKETVDMAYITNPTVKYKEAWVGDYLICKYDNIILSKGRNPYWDWDGILITDDEEGQLEKADGEARRTLFNQIKLDQEGRSLPLKEGEKGFGEEEVIDPNEERTEPLTYKSYFFNHFDQPRKPYIYGTILNNESSPIGRTDFITLSIPLQRAIDKRKQDIGFNCELVNGIIKVDSEVMNKADAQSLAYEAKGIIWGAGVVNGVQRETGEPLPAMVFQDMQDSRQEIDNIMAASSAFRGEREGQETKAGRLALIEQSFLRLNELVQLTDFLYGEVFNWLYQLSKTRYTEYHYAKWMGEEDTTEIMGLIQDDFEAGSEIQIVPGKTLPVDSEFRFERAQKDIAAGIISPIDYFEEAGYTSPKELAKNAQLYAINPNDAVGITPEELQELAPPAAPEEKPPNVTINYSDLPIDAQVQLLGQIGIEANPEIIIAEKTAELNDKRTELEFKRQTPKGEVEVKQEFDR